MPGARVNTPTTKSCSSTCSVRPADARRRARLALASLGVLTLLAACARSPAHDRDPSAPPPTAPAPSADATVSPESLANPVLPATSDVLAPSEMRVQGKLAGRDVADVEACESCHADVGAQWRTSAHAFSSFDNPIYRVSVERLRAEVGLDKSRLCGGCHDVALMVERGLDTPVAPADPRAHAGITCRTCHSIVHTTVDGNGSYTLTDAPIPAPKLGDRPSIDAHIARVAQPPLRTAEMCATCHRVFLGPPGGNAKHLAGQDDYGPFLRSVYAGSRAARVDDAATERDCRGCHMPMEEATLGDLAATNGRVASHRFLGAHTWLASMRKDADALRRAREFLRGAASIDVAVAVGPDGARTLPADHAAVTPGTRTVFDVVVRNQRVGHRFPGGTLDSQDTWIEVEIRDARGQLVAEAGTEHEKTGDDATAHRLRAAIAGDDGVPLMERQVNRFRAVVFNHTLLPREATVVQYAFDVPADLPADAQPLRVSARLRHRSRPLALQAAACADASSARGKDFAAHRPLTGLPVAPDPCPPQPMVDIAESEVWIGAGSEGHAGTGGADRPAWRRLYEHGLGMTRAVQERLDEARPSLERALADLDKTGGNAKDRAMVLSALSYLAGHQGRTEEALGVLARIEPLVPGHPAIGHLRGEALSLVWRWSAATGPLREAALGAPRDDSAWTMLALAQGSAGQDAAVLESAARGLALAPRDPDLLRTQALALEALRAPDDVVERARRGYLDHRVADDAPGVRARCSAKVPGCALERVPVHAHPLRSAR